MDVVYLIMTSKNSPLHLLYLSTKEYRFCIPVAEVERLLLLMEIQEVPQAPDYLVGLMNLYGEAVPVIDLALRIGIKHKDDYSVQTPIVLVCCGQQKSALIIDNIEGVNKVNKNQIRAERLFEGGQYLVKGTVMARDGTALLLDTQRVIDIDLNISDIPFVLGEELLSLCKIKTTTNEHNFGAEHNE